MKSLALIALSASTVFAADLDERVAMLECKMSRVCQDSPSCCNSGARFAAGRPVTSGYDWSAFGDALYWKFYEGGTDYAIKNYSTLPTESGRMERLSFDWYTGYRIGFTAGFADHWDVLVSYTHLKPEAKDSEKAPAGGELNEVSPFFISGSSGKAEAFLKYSVLNVEIGSSYFSSRSFYLRPHFGAQGAWIHQKMKAFFSDNINSTQNNFSGGGLRTGMDSKWFLWHNWSFVCNGALSALYGPCKVTMHEQSPVDSQTSDDIHLIVPAAQMFLGLCWEANFAQDANHIALTLGYEANYWWRQNQLVRFENGAGQPPYGTRISEDLSAQGLTFDFSLYF